MWRDEILNAKAFDRYQQLKKVRVQFTSNWTQPIRLEDAANIAAMETKHFGKFFKHKVGVGFKQWTTLWRIRMAVELIQNDQQHPLMQVAFDVGFGDYGTFERAFKKYVGLCPNKFRRGIIF